VGADHASLSRPIGAAEMLTITTVIIFMFVGTGLAQEPAGRKIYPVDESHLDPSFAEFKVNLLKAVETQDREFLRSALAPDVQLSFGPFMSADRVMATFEKNDSARWKELHRLLSMGVKSLADGQRFLAPYVGYVISKREITFDLYTNAVITDENVEVYAEPRPTAPIITLLSYDIVKYDPFSKNYVDNLIEGERWSWFKATIPDGRTGYVRGKYVYGGFSYRAEFAKQEGQWKLIYMLAGD